MVSKASYQLIELGQLGSQATSLRKLVEERLTDLGLDPGAISFLAESEYAQRDSLVPTVAIFFGYHGADDGRHPTLSALSLDSHVVIPVVSDLTLVSTELPLSLRHINAFAASPSNPNLDRVVSLVLEVFRLLRRERRLFISYKRNDAEALANQLYNALDACGFDVFIDTRSVPPAVDFQEELWHRLADSDVVVLVDTPGFRTSRWTTEELTRANATNIQILHILWPGQPEDGESSFSHFYQLTPDAFANWEQPSKARELTPAALENICRFAERLRAKAIAARHRYLVDGFCDAARDHGLSPNIQPQRWISVMLPSGKELAVVPTVGVPTSDRIDHIFNSIAASGGGSAGTWILYDSRGLLGSWLRHLEWLDSYLPARSLQVAFAYDALGRAGHD